VARRPEGLHIRWRSGIAYARFTHAGQDFSLTTRERDPRRATAAAARIYDRIVGAAGRTLPVGHASTLSLEVLTAEWVADLEATHEARTAHEYDLVATKWCDRWRTLGELTTSELADYQRERLRVVSRETVRKSLVMLRSFSAWCLEKGFLDVRLDVPTIPRRTTGTRARAAYERVPLTEAQALRMIAKLPELGTESERHEQFRVRDWATVAWETALRPITIAKLRTPEHFAAGERVLRITADIDKARFARELPLTMKAREALERSLSKEPGLIFGSHDYREHLKTVGNRVLRRSVSPYDLRHSRITMWVREGKDLLGIQFLAGHKDLSTTAKYAHARAEAARKVLGVRR
jgi:site-specific recombinase XerD